MLGPAMRELFLELDKFGPDKRTTFENQLHSELLDVAQVLGAAQRVMTTERREPGEPLSLAAMKRDIEESPILKTYIDLGSGPVSTTVNTKCSKSDCPNKRIK